MNDKQKITAADVVTAAFPSWADEGGEIESLGSWQRRADDLFTAILAVMTPAQQLAVYVAVTGSAKHWDWRKHLIEFVAEEP